MDRSKIDRLIKMLYHTGLAALFLSIIFWTYISFGLKTTNYFFVICILLLFAAIRRKKDPLIKMLYYTSLAALFYLVMFSKYSLDPIITKYFFVICILSFFAAIRSKENRLILCYVGLVALFSAIFSTYMIFDGGASISVRQDLGIIFPATFPIYMILDEKFQGIDWGLARLIILVICILSLTLGGILDIIRSIKYPRPYIEGLEFYNDKNENRSRK